MKKTKRFAIIIYAIILLLSFTVQSDSLHIMLTRPENPTMSNNQLVSNYDIANVSEIEISTVNYSNPINYTTKNKNEVIVIFDYLNELTLYEGGANWPAVSDAATMCFDFKYPSDLTVTNHFYYDVIMWFNYRTGTPGKEFFVDQPQSYLVEDIILALKSDDINFDELSVVYSPWATDSVLRAQEFGILFDHHKYNYQKPIYRYEFAEMIYNLLSLDEYYEGERIFKDTRNCYIETLYDKGIINGKDTDLFCPYDYITREEASTILARASKYLIEKHGIVPLELQTSEFTDRADISDWAIESVEQMQKIGVLSGYEDGTFRPRGTITKEEAVTAMVNVLMLSVDDEVKLRKNT